jgi:hypothetical protein
MAASSPYDSAAPTVSRPVMIHTTNSHPGEPTWRAMSAETMKMPEPIIDPATIIVESSSPSPRMNPSLVCCSISATSVAIGSLKCARTQIHGVNRKRKF